MVISVSPPFTVKSFLVFKICRILSGVIACTREDFEKKPVLFGSEIWIHLGYFESLAIQNSNLVQILRLGVLLPVILYCCALVKFREIGSPQCEINSLVKTLLSRNFCQKSESNLQLSHTEVHSNEIVPSFMNDEELGSGHAI